MSETPDNRSVEEEANILFEKIRNAAAEAEHLKENFNVELNKFQQSLSEAKTDIDTRRGAAEESERQIATIKSAIEGFRTDSQTIFDELNSKSDAIRQEFREIKETKIQANNLKETSVADQYLISEIKTFLDSQSTEIQFKISQLSEQAEQLQNKIKAVDASIEEINSKKDSVNSSADEIQKLRDQAETLKNNAGAEVAAISEIRTNFTTLQEETASTNEQLKNSFQNAEGAIAEINSVHAEVIELRNKLLKDSEEGEEETTSISTEISNLHSKIEELFVALSEKSTEVIGEWEDRKTNFETAHNNFMVESKSQFSELKKKLESEIRELLPGAGAAGLSWTYVDAKAKYGPTNFEYKGEKTDSRWKRFWAWVWHSIKNYSTPIFLYAIFFVPLIPVFWYFLDLLDFAKENPGKLTTELLLLRTAISIPLITVSLFGLSSIRLYRRLFEEYNHKQRVMQLYDSFKREFEKVGSADQQQALLSIMLATVGDKPSLAMHKYDTNIDTSVPNFSFSKMMADAFKGKSL